MNQPVQYKISISPNKSNEGRTMVGLEEVVSGDELKLHNGSVGARRSRKHCSRALLSFLCSSHEGASRRSPVSRTDRGALRTFSFSPQRYCRVESTGPPKGLNVRLHRSQRSARRADRSAQ